MSTPEIKTVAKEVINREPNLDAIKKELMELFEFVKTRYGKTPAIGQHIGEALSFVENGDLRNAGTSLNQISRAFVNDLDKYITLGLDGLLAMQVSSLDKAGKLPEDPTERTHKIKELKSVVEGSLKKRQHIKELFQDVLIKCGVDTSDAEASRETSITNHSTSETLPDLSLKHLSKEALSHVNLCRVLNVPDILSARLEEADQIVPGAVIVVSNVKQVKNSETGKITLAETDEGEKRYLVMLNYGGGDEVPVFKPGSDNEKVSIRKMLELMAAHKKQITVTVNTFTSEEISRLLTIENTTT